MVGSEIDKDMGDSGLSSQNTVYGIAKELSLCTSQRASKKANDAV